MPSLKSSEVHNEASQTLRAVNRKEEVLNGDWREQTDGSLTIEELCQLSDCTLTTSHVRSRNLIAHYFVSLLPIYHNPNTTPAPNTRSFVSSSVSSSISSTSLCSSISSSVSTSVSFRLACLPAIVSTFSSLGLQRNSDECSGYDASFYHALHILQFL